MPHQDDHIDWTQLTNDLAQPFHPNEIKYRAGAINRDKTKAQALPYADPRAYEDRLNTLVPGHWQVEFQPWGEHRIICRLTIHDVTRSSTGESGDSPEEVSGTSAEAQAFKRACTKFGLGRYLYAINPQWVDYDADKRRIKQPPAPAAPSRAPRSQARADAIGRQRAALMQDELVKLGLPRQKQLNFTKQLLGRAVPDLADLDEHEARAVWSAARNLQRERAA